MIAPRSTPLPAAAFAWALATLMQACTTAGAPAVASDAERHRDLVMAFYKQALMERDPRAAFARFASPDFVDHKPEMPVGSREAAAGYLESLIRRFPDPHWEVVRTVAEGDLVVLHVRFRPTPEAKPYAIVDIFRIRDDRLVEHWDVVAEPPDEQRNPNSRF